MNRTSIFYDLISSVFETRFPISRLKDSRSIEKLCAELLTSKGEVSASRLGQLILDQFERLSDEEIFAFFRYLTNELDIDTDAVLAAATAYQSEKSSQNL